MQQNQQVIADRLLQFWQTQKQEGLIPTLVSNAEQLIYGNPFAFLLAASLDRGIKAEIVWTLPYWLQQEFGHLDPCRIKLMSEEQISNILKRLPKKPRYMNDAPKTIQQLAEFVCDSLMGNAANLWQGKSAKHVQTELMKLHGVGKGIAAMTVILLIRLKLADFTDLREIPIKPDIHVQRVTYRAGLAEEMSEKEALRAACKLNPTFPGDLDSPLWLIGRNWCTAHDPNCKDCPISNLCPRVSV